MFPDARPTNMPRSPVTALMDPTIVGDQMVSSLLDDDLAASLVFFLEEEEEEEEEVYRIEDEDDMQCPSMDIHNWRPSFASQ